MIVHFVSNYYRTVTVSENFKLVPIAENALFKSLKNIEVTKVAETDQSSAKSLNDGMWILVKPITELCNLFMILKLFPDACKIAKLKPLCKRVLKMDSLN